MSVNAEIIKKRTRAIQNKLKEFEHKVALGQCQELVAISLGFKNSHLLKNQYPDSSLTEALDVFLKRKKKFSIPLNCSDTEEAWEISCAIIEIDEKDIRILEKHSENPFLQDIDSFTLSLPNIKISYASISEGSYSVFDNVNILPLDNENRCTLDPKQNDSLYEGDNHFLIEELDFNKQSMKETNIRVHVQKDGIVTFFLEYCGHKTKSITYKAVLFLDEMKNINWLKNS